jgi:hypothetical protein
VGKTSKLTSSERAKDARLRKIYKITLEEFKAKCAAQGNRCAICSRSFDEFQAHQDHDHTCCKPGRKIQRYYCGKCNRDILCYLCNRWAVGGMEYCRKVGIDPQKVLEYVIKWGMRAKEKAKESPQK